jgi:hypothetical protein
VVVLPNGKVRFFPKGKSFGKKHNNKARFFNKSLACFFSDIWLTPSDILPNGKVIFGFQPSDIFSLTGKSCGNNIIKKPCEISQGF